jgi:aryl-alcohol dehydrogenase-like predicted oxidoreductase
VASFETKQQFGLSDLFVSRLVLGTGGFGTHMSDTDSLDVLSAYVDAGGNFIDTANVYGRWAAAGEPTSERLIGDWLAGNGHRERLVLATKGGCPPLSDMSKSRMSREDIEHDINDSLKNLRTDYIDLYWLHHDDPARPVEDIVGSLVSLRRAGKIRYFGLSNWRHPRLRQAFAAAEATAPGSFVSIQKMWNVAMVNPQRLTVERMTFFDEGDARLLSDTGLQLVCYSSQAQGYFAGFQRPDFSSSEPFRNAREFYENPRSRARAEIISRIARQLAADPTAIALRALLNSKLPAWPIIGPANRSQLQTTLTALDGAFLPKDVADILNTIAVPAREEEVTY